ncbi:ABC transporter permease [Paenibacillus alvei]|uniref:ABC transporter permease n=1 Tax=Paenibacillus alvei TaxID=44250 RepID=A0AAP7DHR3_PAEAL|nr:MULTISPECIES: ABC transporter permease [Paenibacillus]EJW19352.1 putative ABC transporter permease protein YufQ [Paenibacillus alvei DSM 29]MBG9734920.1 sugar ABC transporter permease [Paenibacillus alvei]MBG9744795.1 sugar ABC transporter permease [Paenibacillus alvei]MCY7483742.1 ABC transporter permease [Paenibacillus alvei]MCY9539351.1 ABC transporter permease [Paenibacillus alvei]
MDILANLLNGTFVFATALIFAALGGVIVERTGVINLGLEGFMVSGAFAAAITTHYAENAGLGGASPWLGLLGAMIFTLIFSGIHAIASIKFKANQVISGIVVNLLAASSTFFMVKLLFEGSAETPIIDHVFFKWSIPFLSDIPFLGNAFFTAYPTTYIAYICVFVVWFVMYKTPLGLRMRAVGEHPGAADTAGVKVNRLRTLSILVGGSIASLGGATVALTANSSFAQNTISGQGFIALAAVIFGKWNPVGAFGAAIFFGFAQALKDQVVIYDWAKSIPTEVFYMLPYLLTLLVLLFAVGRTSGPSALGETYDPGKR